MKTCIIISMAAIALVMLTAFSVETGQAQGYDLGLISTGVTTTTIKITWFDWWTTETGYRIERIVTGQSWTSAVTTTVISNTIVYTLTGLAQSTSYTIRVIPYQGTTNYDVYDNEITVMTYPHATPVPTPQPTATPANIPKVVATAAYAECGVQDQSFLRGDQSAWAVSSGVTWRPGRMEIPIGQSITQTVVSLSSQFSVTLKASAPTTSTFRFMAGAVSSDFVVTKTVMQTFRVNVTQSSPFNVMLTTLTGGPVRIGGVCLERTDMVGPLSFPVGPFGEVPIGIARGIDLGQFTDFFAPFELTYYPEVDFFGSTDWTTFFWTAGHVFGTFLSLTSANTVKFYIGARIVMICMLWFAGWVMKQIGHPIPQTNEQVYIVPGIPSGMRRYKLPSLGPSMMRGGRRRRSRW